MNLSAIWYESWRNLRSGSSRVVASVLVLSALLATIASLEIVVLSAVRQARDTYVASAADVKIVQAGGLVDVRACDELSGRHDVSASGALSGGDDLELLGDPGSRFSVYEVTSGFVALLAVDGDGSGVVISAQLAERTGLGVGDLVETDHGIFRLTGVFHWPEDGRDARLSYAFLNPSATLADADECWVRLDLGHGQPYAREVLSSTLRTGIDAGGGSFGQVNNTLGSDLSPSRLYSERMTRHAWLGAAVAGTCVGAALAWRRRLSWASDLHAGARRVDLLAVVCVERVVTMAAAALVVSGGCVVSLALVRPPAAWGDFLSPGLVVAAWGLLGFFVGSVVSVSVIREAWLFRLFTLR